MNARFLTMLVIGVILMIAFWVKQCTFDQEYAETIAPITGCLKDGQCPEDKSICLATNHSPNGLCTSRCTKPNQCSEGWCCAQAPGKKEGEFMCLPMDDCPSRQ